MPRCPRCGEHFSFHEIGVHNILEGEDAEWFLEGTPPTPEQIQAFRDAIRIYRDSVKSGRFVPGWSDV